MEKFETTTAIDECDILQYRMLMCKKINDLISEIGNKKQGVTANVNNCLDTFKDKTQPEEFTTLDIHGKFTTFKANVEALKAVEKKVKDTIVENIMEIRDEAKQCYAAVEEGKQTLQKMLVTLREVRTKTRTVDNNAKRKRQAEVLKILKPFSDGSMPNEIMPFLCNVFEEGEWGTIPDMMANMDSTDVFHKKEDNPITAKDNN